MDSLPSEIVYQILLYLPIKDLLSFLLGNKCLNLFLEDSHLWKELMKRDHPDRKLPPEGKKPYLEVPYLEVPYLEVPYLEVPYMEVPYMEVPYMEVYQYYYRYSRYEKERAKVISLPESVCPVNQKYEFWDELGRWYYQDMINNNVEILSFLKNQGARRGDIIQLTPWQPSTVDDTEYWSTNWNNGMFIWTGFSVKILYWEIYQSHGGIPQGFPAIDEFPSDHWLETMIRLPYSVYFHADPYIEEIIFNLRPRKGFTVSSCRYKSFFRYWTGQIYKLRIYENNYYIGGRELKHQGESLHQEVRDKLQRNRFEAVVNWQHHLETHIGGHRMEKVRVSDPTTLVLYIDGPKPTKEQYEREQYEEEHIQWPNASNLSTWE